MGATDAVAPNLPYPPEGVFREMLSLCRARSVAAAPRHSALAMQITRIIW
jgi:hypothetical protein